MNTLSTAHNQMNRLINKPLSVLLLLMLIWMLDVFVMPTFKTLDENNIDANKEEVEVSTTPQSSDDESMAMDLPAVVLPTPINLPSPPQLAKKPESLSSPQTLVQAQAEIVEPNSSHTAQMSYQAVASVSKTQVYSSYQALNELDAQSLSFILPNNKQERAKLLRFLYTCQGMQFGAIIEQNGQSSLMLLNQKQDTRGSQLLRVVHGDLSENEARLLNAYAPRATPVRVFPERIDLVLSAYLSAFLNTQQNGTSLSQFRGQYLLKRNTLLLTNLVINEHNVEDTWELAKSNCIV